MAKNRIQIAKSLALKNIIKYVCKVAGSDFLADDDKSIKEELSVLCGEVEESVNEK